MDPAKNSGPRFICGTRHAKPRHRPNLEKTGRLIYGRFVALDYANTDSGREFRDAGPSSAGRRSVANGVSPNRRR